MTRPEIYDKLIKGYFKKQLHVEIFAKIRIIAFSQSVYEYLFNVCTKRYEYLSNV